MSKQKFNLTDYPGVFWYDTKTKGKLYAIRIRYKDQYEGWKEKPEQGFKTLKVARARKRELEELLDNNPAAIENNKTTFREWGEKYFELLSPTWSHDTILNFNSAFYKHLAELHNILLVKLTKAVYQNHINYLLFERDYAESTVKRNHTIAMAIINSAVDHDILVKNKLRNISIHKLSIPKKKFLEIDELRKIDKVASETLNVAGYACYALLRMGWRRSEVMGLIAEGVKVIDNNTVDVSVLETRGRYIERATPKSKTAYRTIRLKGDFATAVIKAVELSKKIHYDNNTTFTDKSRILINKRGITRHRNYPMEVCNKLSTKTKIAIHPHKLRHTLVTHARQKGVNLVNIQEWVGHADIRTTLLYTHATDEGRDELVDLANTQPHE